MALTRVPRFFRPPTSRRRTPRRATARRFASGFGALALFLLACSTDGPLRAPVPPFNSAAPTGPSGTLNVGQAYTDRAGYVQYVPGDAPVVIVASHGGTMSPAALPDRSCAGCVTTADLNTQDLARVVVDSFLARTGTRPHLIVNLLHRRKLDANRDMAEATGGTRTLDTTWLWFQAAIDTARARVQRQHARGLVVDLHGHAHAVPRLELGYLLTASTLRLSDAAMTSRGDMSRSSLSAIAANSRATGERGVALLRGTTSLGNIMIARGYRAVPSSVEPAPLDGEAYFSGGYITERHGSSAGGTVDAVQIECHFDGVRDSAATRARFAGALTDGLRFFLDRHYGWSTSS